jgi:hypothetical protein
MSRSHKGQAELVVVLGLIVVAVVAIYYGYQGLVTPVTVPTDVAQEQNLIKDSVNNMIRSGAISVLGDLSTHGGYTDTGAFTQGAVTLNGKAVPYWQRNGQTSIPDAHANFINGLREYINRNKDYVASPGKEVTVESPVVSANFLSSKIDITVNMPVTLWVDGVAYPIREPYRVSVQTGFEDAYEFSKSLVSQARTNRFFETFTMHSVLLSDIESGVKKLPVFLILNECGEAVYKDWYDLKPEMEYAIKVTLAHTYMPGKVPLNVIRTTSYPKYSLPALNGKKYSDLDITFHLPDDFKLTQSTFQFSPNPISAYAEPLPFMTICQSDPVLVNYMVTYPMIVRVKDPLTGNVFQFANHVYIYNNNAGDFGALAGYEPGSQADICGDKICPVSVTVKESGGSPVEGAAVRFMGCGLGRTDSNGLLAGRAPCGFGPLRVDADDHAYYEEMKSANNNGTNEIENIVITLPKKPVVNLYFYEVIVEDWGDEYRVPFSEGSIKPVEGKTVRIDFSSLDEEKIHSPIITDKASYTMTHIPAGNYVVAASITNNGFTEYYGAFGTGFALGEDVDSIYIYIPNYYGFNSIEDYEARLEKTYALTSVLENCGIYPIRDTEYTQTSMLTCSD